MPITFLLSQEIFWINPVSNTINADQNFQLAHKGDFIQSMNAGNKNLTANPYPYYHFDVQIRFTVSSQDTTKNKNKATNDLYVHLGYITNGIQSGSKDFYNSYFQAQIGLSIDVLNTLKNYKSPKK